MKLSSILLESSSGHRLAAATISRLSDHSNISVASLAKTIDGLLIDGNIDRALVFLKKLESAFGSRRNIKDIIDAVYKHLGL